MSDERVRALERRWRETQTREDLLAWLRARVQAGELTQERLRLAARLGSEVARELLKLDPLGPIGRLPWGWAGDVAQLVRTTRSPASAARARFVLTGQEGPPVCDPGIEEAAFEARSLLSLSRAVLVHVTFRQHEVARAVEALASYVRTQAPADRGASELQTLELASSFEELTAGLSAAALELLPEPPPDGELADLDAIARRFTLSPAREEVEPEVLEELLPLTALLASRACCQLNVRQALGLAEYVLGAQEAADVIGAALVPWVLQLVPGS